MTKSLSCRKLYNWDRHLNCLGKYFDYNITNGLDSKLQKYFTK